MDIFFQAPDVRKEITRNIFKRGTRRDICENENFKMLLALALLFKDFFVLRKFEGC